MFVKAVQVQKFIKAQLWGEAKQGKTRFALSFPGPIAVIDSEKGSLPYAEQYAFDYKEAVRWDALKPPLEWLKREKGAGYKTLAIDSATPLYEDLVAKVAEAERNRWGRDIISQQGWGVIKRAWKGFLAILLELPMHVVLTTRAKDEYENEKDPKTGEDRSHKTGALIADAERSTKYLFDFILECRAAVPPKAKEARYEVVVHGTRRYELPLGTVIDVTKKPAFDVVFGTWVGKLIEGKPLEATAEVAELDGGFTPAKPVAAATAPPTPQPKAEPEGVPEQTLAEREAEVDRFASELLGGARHEGEPASNEDLKVLFTRAGQVRWPDGKKLKTDEAKALIKGLYGVESAKDLRKHEVDFIFDEFGKCLAKKAGLALGEGGVPFIQTYETVP